MGRAEAKLRIHIQQLSLRCNSMSATVSSLDKVRDAIHILGLCPGIGRISFVTPSWAGDFAVETVDLVNVDDQGIDAALEMACKGLNQSFRAVETSELMLKTVTGLPLVNTASVPLMGTCPNCEGDEDEPNGLVHVSGHARVCWDPQATLDTFNRRTDCSDANGRKAVFCVDAHDSIWGNITTWSGISSYSHSYSSGIVGSNTGIVR